MLRSVSSLLAAAVVLLAAQFGLSACSSTAPADSVDPAAVVTVNTGASSVAVQTSSVTAAISDWQVIATSVQGRPIRARTIGDGPRRVLFIGGIHGDEAEGAYSTAQLPRAFIEAGLTDAVTLTILEDANPDGRAAHTRTNANRVDINRNFPATNFDTSNAAYGSQPLSQPESRAVYDTVARLHPDLVVVAHSWQGRQFLNFDGPARQLAERFSALSGLRVEESSAFAPTPGSLGSYVGRDRGIPILTVEVLKGADPKDVWDQIHAALLEVISGLAS
ncbi:DUF2817 domain-containing protein [Mycobacterium sp. NBC_00419]|uniref:M14 family zinc carboxypeptidase n=1 Tax=Mycobacterium sp. NBC_00419 TaxID=2975989 RepID=UPI002E20FD27